MHCKLCFYHSGFCCNDYRNGIERWKWVLIKKCKDYG
jgi:hypothetical protein